MEKSLLSIANLYPLKNKLWLSKKGRFWKMEGFKDLEGKKYSVLRLKRKS